MKEINLSDTLVQNLGSIGLKPIQTFQNKSLRLKNTTQKRQEIQNKSPKLQKKDIVFNMTNNQRLCLPKLAQKSSQKVSQSKHRRYVTEHFSQYKDRNEIKTYKTIYKQQINTKSFDDFFMKQPPNVHENSLKSSSRGKKSIRRLEKNKKFSFDGVIKAQIIPKKKSKILNQEQFLNRLITNIPQLLQQNINPQTKVAYNPEYWKNNQFQKVLNDRIKIRLRTKRFIKKSGMSKNRGELEDSFY